MTYLADLHIHSPFSRATSKLSNLMGLQAWAQAKGIGVIGTGDFTHPGWFSQLQEQLEEAEDGLYRLANPKTPPALEGLCPDEQPVRFCLTAEISSIYKRHDKARKVHNIIFAPDLAAVQRFNQRLAAIGNIESDGRPILGLDSRDLLEIVLEEIPGGFLVPAHIWTPWFSLFGSKSGFDCLEDCYGDLSQHIFALETGLSSDPEMNRLVSALDQYTLISNSDCHSPSKLGREVNIFNCDLSFTAMREAIRHPEQGMTATVEFYPEEGKYHYDGHRKCGVCLDPLSCQQYDNICPVCGKPLTVGVCHRVMELADRNQPHFPEHSPDFESLIPLVEIISELTGVGPTSKTVLKQYVALINRFGSEFAILRTTPLEELGQVSPLLAESMARLRSKKVIRQPGFDGQFGIIHLFAEGEIDKVMGQQDLFLTKRKKKGKKITPINPGLFPTQTKAAPPNNLPGPLRLNPAQQQAITATDPQIMVAAGPGTGKTFVLIERVKTLLARGIPPHKIAAITFTIKASTEIKHRLTSGHPLAPEIFTGTFHAFCLHWLRHVQPSLTVIADQSRQLIIKQLFPVLDNKDHQLIRAEIISYFHLLATSTQQPPTTVAVKNYLKHLERAVAIDLDAIIPTFLRCLADQDFSDMLRHNIAVLLIDEFQDVNQSQYDLVQLLAKWAEVFIIGDPDQAIYGFRGSDLNFFFRFGQELRARTIYLEKNYRSGPTIVQAAAHLIAHNQQRSGLNLQSHSQHHDQISYQRWSHPQEEAQAIVNKIDQLVGGISSLSAGDGNYSFNDIAILLRMNRQAAPLATALHERAIPFQQVGTTPFFMKKQCRLLSLAVLAAAGNCEMGDYLQLFMGLPGIGPGAIAFIEQNLPLDSNMIWPAIFNLDLAPAVRSILEKLVDLLSELGQATDLQPTMLALAKLFSIEPNQPEIERFLQLTAALGPLAAVAHHLQQGRNAIIYDERAEAVSLMTIHGAKGLEFPVVFICGLEEGILPSNYHLEQPEQGTIRVSEGLTAQNDRDFHLNTSGKIDLEEERRLFYVGLTRAKDRLYLNSVKNRHGEKYKESRFISELPPDILTRTTKKIAKKKKKLPQAKQLKLF